MRAGASASSQLVLQSHLALCLCCFALDLPLGWEECGQRGGDPILPCGRTPEGSDSAPGFSLLSRAFSGISGLYEASQDRFPRWAVSAGVTMAQSHSQLNLEQQECSAQDLFDQRGQAGGRKEAGRQWGIGSATRSWQQQQLMLKSPFLKKGIKKILPLISKNCLRHNVERHLFISAPGRARAGFISAFISVGFILL